MLFFCFFLEKKDIYSKSTLKYNQPKLKTSPSSPCTTLPSVLDHITVTFYPAMISAGLSQNPGMYFFLKIFIDMGKLPEKYYISFTKDCKPAYFLTSFPSIIYLLNFSLRSINQKCFTCRFLNY